MSYTAFSVNNSTVYQGSGCISMIPEILKKEGWTKVMVVAGPSIMKTGAIKPFEDMLNEAGITYKIWSDIKPNPLIEDVEKTGVPMYQEMDADVMLAIGGGSTMDSAKGVAIIGESGMNLIDIAEPWGKYPIHDALPWKTYPIIAVPTTCGTGSEVLRNAVISEPGGRKVVAIHDTIIPKYAICDPDMLATLPRSVAAASGMDALVQAIEGTVSNAATEYARTFGFRAIELIGPIYRKYVDDPANKEYADAMSKACMYAGLCWHYSFPAQNHGCNHPITERLHISHGAACGIVMPWFIEWNGPARKEDFCKIYNMMVPDAKVALEDFDVSMLVEEFKEINRYVGIRGAAMKEAGCTEELCAEMTKNFATRPTQPVPTSKEQMCAAMIDMMNGKYD